MGKEQTPEPVVEVPAKVEAPAPQVQPIPNGRAQEALQTARQAGTVAPTEPTTLAPAAAPFDLFKLTPEQQAALTRLRAASSPDEIKTASEAAVKAGIPKDDVDRVVRGMASAGGKAAEFFLSGKHDVVSTDEQGRPTSKVKASLAGAEWETAEQKGSVKVAADGVRGRGTDKDADVEVGAGVKWGKAANLKEAQTAKDNLRGSVDVRVGKTKVEAEAGKSDAVVVAEGQDAGGNTHRAKATGQYGEEKQGAGVEYRETGKGPDADRLQVDASGSRAKDGTLRGEAGTSGKEGDIDWNARVAGSGSNEGDTAKGEGSGSVVVGQGAKPGDRIEGRLRVTGSTKRGAEEATDVSVDAGATVKDTEVSAGYQGKRGEDTSLDQVTFDAAQRFHLTDGQSLKLRLNTKIAVPADADAFDVSVGATGVLESGQGKSLTVNVEGGQQREKDLIGSTGSTGVTGDDRDAGYGKASVTGTDGERSYGASLLLGGSDRTFGARLSGNYKDANGKADLLMGLAEQDGKTAAMIKASTEWAVAEGHKVSAGFGVTLKPLDEGYQALWNAYARYGVDLGDKRNLRVQIGVDSNGETVAWNPELIYEDELIKAGVGARLPHEGDVAVGADVLYKPFGLGLSVGYGDPAEARRGSPDAMGIGSPESDALMDERFGEQWNMMLRLEENF